MARRAMDDQRARTPGFRPDHGAGEPISAPGLPRRNAHAGAAGLARSAVAVTPRSRRLVRRRARSAWRDRRAGGGIARWA
jgi:hypothetical protein